MNQSQIKQLSSLSNLSISMFTQMLSHYQNVKPNWTLCWYLGHFQWITPEYIIFMKHCSLVLDFLIHKIISCITTTYLYSLLFKICSTKYVLLGNKINQSKINLFCLQNLLIKYRNISRVKVKFLALLRKNKF